VSKVANSKLILTIKWSSLECTRHSGFFHVSPLDFLLHFQSVSWTCYYWSQTIRKNCWWNWQLRCCFTIEAIYLSAKSTTSWTIFVQFCLHSLRYEPSQKTESGQAIMNTARNFYDSQWTSGKTSLLPWKLDCVLSRLERWRKIIIEHSWHQQRSKCKRKRKN